MRVSRTLTAAVIASTAMTFAPAVATAQETTPETDSSATLEGLDGSLKGSTGQPDNNVDHWNLIRALAGQFHIALSGIGPAATSQEMSAVSSLDEALLYNAETSAEGSIAAATATSGGDVARPIFGVIGITAVIAAAIGGWVAWEAANNR